jgi:glyoxylase-like metal-dependent hydrolase (beta-lactamase superfamily II)
MGLISQSFVLGPFATNAYLVTCEDTRETAIIDVGFEAERMVEEVRRQQLQVRYLLNTHAHYDHIAMMAVVQRELGGRIGSIRRTVSCSKGFPSKAPRSAFLRSEPRKRCTSSSTVSRSRSATAARGDPYAGHSPGSVTFRWNDWLWVGDVLFAGSIGRTDLPGGSFDTLFETIRHRLFPLGDDLRVLPGHGPETTLGVERRTNPFVGDGVGLA